MDHPIDPITEADLQAYVEDQLPVGRRIEVEAHLSHRPEEAVRVMADLRIRDELRLALAGMPRMGRVDTTDAARRLERGLARDRWFGRMQKAAAVVFLVGAGWLAHAELGALRVGEVVASALPPPYVSDALRAHQTALMRASMPSQPEAPDYDPAEIRAATAVELPVLPKGWAVTDVQVFPSTFGPSVEMALATDGFGTASLFAVRPGAFDVVAPALVPEGELIAAYWQIGDVAYVLVAEAKARELDRVADRLARSLY